MALRLLQAEALLMAGRTGEAIDHACAAAAGADSQAFETLPRVGRIMGKLHAATGRPGEAIEWFERSARVLAAASDECARAEVLDDYADFLAGAIGMPADRPAAPRVCPPCLRTTARHITVRADAATRLGPAAQAVASASALDHAAAVVDFGGRPLCLGLEVFAMLERHASLAHAAISTSGGARGTEVLRSWGDCAIVQSLVGGERAAERIGLGRWREQDVDLVVEVPSDLPARAAVIAARRLVGASVALDAARREQRERAALWPVDDPVEARHGVFASQSMTELLATARKIAASNATVLITGETGTGKEVLARVIHDTSPRAARPFVPFNCTAVPREMLDSQLFGYRRGAFTGAVTHFPGVIRNAAGGTLLLDEIGEVSLDLQPKLLRFLEAQEIHPLGELQPLSVDVRVLAATNANLEDLVASGRFREDLYYRLNVIRLRVPPLRERREEIPVLVQHYLERFAAENKKENLRVAEETMEYLLLYPWPGNVRELVNQVHRLAALAENGAVLMPEHLAPEIAATRRTVPASDRQLAATEVVVRLDQPLAAAFEHVERAMIPYAMRASDGRVEVAARMLGLSRKGLYLKRQRLGVDGTEAPPAQPEPPQKVWRGEDV